MPKEIEIKARVKDFKKIKDRLKKLNAKFVGKEFERNITLDFPDRRLERAGCLLRIRKVGGKTILTYKSAKKDPKKRVREEIETTVRDAKSILDIFNRLGLEKACVYEKKRETYSLPGALVVLDELPKLGRFVEIEVKKGGIIDKITKSLGISKKDMTTKHYGHLVRKYWKRTGKRCDIIF